jgi:hypothetical protein
MLAVFCLRLGCGLMSALMLLPTSLVNPRFFRTHFLTVLGLIGLAAVVLRDQGDLLLWVALGSGLVLAFLGSVSWHLQGAPAGKILMFVLVPVLAAALVLAGQATREQQESIMLLADDMASAALLGTATTAMLMGHSYLIAPAMSLNPLMRLLLALGICLVFRTGVAGLGLWLWTAESAGSNLETETLLWLPVRWGLGFVLPGVLGWMAWETARIRSTQSATGILYVVVILCFLGELTGQLLLGKTGYTM